MCGYQVKIGKVFVVDAFAGIGVVKTNAAGFFRNYGKDMDQYETLAAELGTAGKGFSNYRAGADHYFSFFYYKGGLPMIRAGLCIGVAFPGLKSVPLNFD